MKLLDFSFDIRNICWSCYISNKVNFMKGGEYFVNFISIERSTKENMFETRI